MRTTLLLISLTALSASLFFTSCSHKSKHNYYMLSPSGPAAINQDLGIGIGPVNTASYLDRPYLIFQSSHNTLDVNEDHEWAGDLTDEFARVLGTNIGREKNTGNIQSYPWGNESDLDYQVSINLKRFHGTSNGNALLEASWSVYKLPGARRIESKSITLTEPLQSDGFSSLAAAQSRLVEKLAQRIVQSLR